MKRDNAFSLLEVLAAVAIVLILSALVLPVTAKLRENAKKAQCISRMKTLGNGVAIYVGENDGCLPYGKYQGPYPGMPLYPTWEDLLISSIEPTVRPMVDWWAYKKVFDCPASPDGSATKKALQAGAFSTSYAYNPDVLIDVAGAAPSLKSAAINRPSRNLVLACASKRPAIPYNKVDDPDSVGFTKHPAGANALFLDGHVESVTALTINDAVADQIVGGRRVLRD